jgi:hypothetical protein
VCLLIVASMLFYRSIDTRCRRGREHLDETAWRAPNRGYQVLPEIDRAGTGGGPPLPNRKLYGGWQTHESWAKYMKLLRGRRAASYKTEKGEKRRSVTNTDRPHGARDYRSRERRARCSNGSSAVTLVVRGAVVHAARR